MAGSVEINLLDIDLNMDILKVQNEIASKMAADLKATSPKSSHKGTHYANGWTFTQDGKDVVVYNKGRKAPLSHLLELGHMARDGSFVAPRPHIAPAYDKYGAEFDKKLKSIEIKSK